MDIQSIVPKVSDLLTSFSYYGELIGFLAGVFSKFFYDFYEGWKGEWKDEKSYDKQLFVEIRDKLLTVDMMLFFRDFNAQENLPRNYMYPLFGFVDTKLYDPKLIFLNKKTEKIKIKLFQEIQDIMYSLSLETYNLEGNMDYQSVPKEWRISDTKRYEHITTLLQNKAEETWQSYERFLEYGRNRFKA